MKDHLPPTDLTFPEEPVESERRRTHSALENTTEELLEEAAATIERAHRAVARSREVASCRFRPISSRKQGLIH
jgi:hypothetical protein